MIHLEKNGRAACQKRFNFRTDVQRNYQTAAKEKFLEYLSGKSTYANENHCCKKCQKLIK